MSRPIRVRFNTSWISGENNQRENHDVKPVVGNLQRIVQPQRAAHPVGRHHRPVERRKNRPHRLLQDEAHAEGREQRLERSAVKKSNNGALHQDARQPRNDKRRRNRHQNRDPDVFGHRHLNDVGGVRAEHHQLTVSHVDDAHDAERNGQPDGDQHQHRTQAQAKEQRLDARIESTPMVDGCPPRRRRPAEPSRLFPHSCRREICRATTPAGSGRPDSRSREAWRPLPAVRPRPSHRAQPAPRPVAISFLTPESVSTRNRSRSNATVRSSSDFDISRTASEPHRRIRARQRELRQRHPQDAPQSVVSADLTQAARRGRADLLQRERIA